MSRIRFPAVEDFSLLYSVQTDSEAHPVSYHIAIRGSLPGVKRSESEADDSISFSTEVKKDGAIPPLPSICFHGIVVN